jgi:hypothetical protein
LPFFFSFDSGKNGQLISGTDKYQEISKVQVTKSREAKALPTAGRSLREEKK